MSLLKKSWYILFSFIAFCTSSEDDSKEILVQPSDFVKRDYINKQKAYYIDYNNSTKSYTRINASMNKCSKHDLIMDFQKKIS